MQPKERRLTGLRGAGLEEWIGFLVFKTEVIFGCEEQGGSRNKTNQQVKKIDAAVLNRKAPLVVDSCTFADKVKGDIMVSLSCSFT
jgi:hypothetical protein